MAAETLTVRRLNRALLARQQLLDRGTAPLVEVLERATWDSTLLTHARRTQILPERYRPLVFSTRMPRSVGTFLIASQVVGSWRYGSGAVTVKPFGKLSRAERRGVDEEAARLAAFHSD